LFDCLPAPAVRFPPTVGGQIRSTRRSRMAAIIDPQGAAINVIAYMQPSG